MHYGRVLFRVLDVFIYACMGKWAPYFHNREKFSLLGNFSKDIKFYILKRFTLSIYISILLDVATCYNKKFTSFWILNKFYWKRNLWPLHLPKKIENFLLHLYFLEGKNSPWCHLTTHFFAIKFLWHEFYWFADNVSDRRVKKKPKDVTCSIKLILAFL